MRKKFDWAQIRYEYITGDESARDIAARIGASPRYIAKKITTEGWFDERKEHQKKRAELKSEAHLRSAAKTREKLFEVADRLLDAIQEGIADGTIPMVGKGYRDVTGALKDIKDIKEIKDPITEKEQIARIERLRAETKAANERQTGTEIKITLAADLEEYTD